VCKIALAKPPREHGAWRDFAHAVVASRYDRVRKGALKLCACLIVREARLCTPYGTAVSHAFANTVY